MAMRMNPGFGEWLQQAALDAIDRDIAPEIVRDAKRNAPVDTGRLQSSIDKTRAADRVIIYADTEYAPFVELGTSKMSAQPYLRPALYKKRG